MKLYSFPAYFCPGCLPASLARSLVMKDRLLCRVRSFVRSVAACGGLRKNLSLSHCVGAIHLLSARDLSFATFFAGRPARRRRTAAAAARAKFALRPFIIAFRFVQCTFLFSSRQAGRQAGRPTAIRMAAQIFPRYSRTTYIQYSPSVFLSQ